MLSFPYQEEVRRPAALADLTRVIGPGGDDLARTAGVPRRPILLLVGTPGSGATATLSWLARSGRFAVPSELLAHFWRAPAVGALVEQLLRDTAWCGAPDDATDLWRHFLGFGDPPLLGDVGRARADVSGFRGHLAAWERIAARPLAMKALIAAWELPFVASALPTAVFLDLHRDPLATAAALLAAREQRCGDRRTWHSFRPPVPIPEDATPEEQVCIQVRRMREAVDAGLAHIEPSRVLQVSFETLCTAPADVWQTLRERFEPLGETLPSEAPDLARRLDPPANDPALARAWERAR